MECSICLRVELWEDGRVRTRNNALHNFFHYYAAVDLYGSIPGATQEEGEQGRKINQYTRYGTVILAFFQSWGIAAGIEAQGLASEPGLFLEYLCCDIGWWNDALMWLESK